MDLNHLRIFVALAESENMTLTAARLGVPQPSVSRALARLEADAGRPLFRRHGRRLILNAEGRAFAPYARSAIGSLEAGLNRLEARADPETGVVRLGFLHSLGSWLVPALLRDFRRERPRVEVTLFQASAAELRAGLQDETLDVIISGPRPEGVAWQALFRQRLVVAVAPGHPLAEEVGQGGDLALADALRFPVLGLTPGHGMRKVVDSLLAAEGLEPTIAFEGSDLETLRGLAAAGLGVAFVPAHRRGTSAGTVIELPLRSSGAYRDIGVGTTLVAEPAPVVATFTQFVAHHLPALAARLAGDDAVMAAEPWESTTTAGASA